MMVSKRGVNIIAVAALCAILAVMAGQALAGPLHEVVERGDMNAVGSLLKKGGDINKRTDINEKDAAGRTAVMIAVSKHRPDIVKLLLESGADVNKQDDRGVSPLIEAASRGQTDTVQLLIKHGADVNAKDSGARTAFMVAEAGKYQDIIDLLKKAGARSQPLHEAVERGDVEAVRRLLMKGADVNAKDNEGRTALVLAIFEDKRRSPNDDGVTPLEKLLMEYKADVNAKDNKGRTALMAAVEKWNVDMVKFLIKQKADVNAKDDKGVTALMETAFGGKAGVKIDLMELLLKHKADINAKDNEGETALMKAAFEGYLDAVRSLIEHQADVNAKDNNGETALMKTAVRHYAEHRQAASLLIEHGADVNAKDNSGRTALMFAANEGSAEMAELLIKHKAELNAKDNEGRTARTIAKGKGFVNIATMLQDAEEAVTLHAPGAPQALLDELRVVKPRGDGCSATFEPLPLPLYRQWHQAAYRAADGRMRPNQTAWIELKRRPELLDELRAAKLAGLGRLMAYARLLDQDSLIAGQARDRMRRVKSEIADLDRIRGVVAKLDERAFAGLTEEQWKRKADKLGVGVLESGWDALYPDLNWMGTRESTADVCKKDVRDVDVAELIGGSLENTFEEAIVRELSLGQVVRLSKLVHEVKTRSEFVKWANFWSSPRIELDEKTKSAIAVDVERHRFSLKINWGQNGSQSAPFEHRRVTRSEWHAFLRKLDLAR